VGGDGRCRRGKAGMGGDGRESEIKGGTDTPKANGMKERNGDGKA